MIDRISLLLTYTPRADVDLAAYHDWLRLTDNPFFNSRPAVRRYVNYRVERSMMGEAGFTHFDLLEIEAGDETAVFGDPEIAAFARAWVEQWGANPADPGDPVNYHVHICRTVAAPENTPS